MMNRSSIRVDQVFGFWIAGKFDVQIPLFIAERKAGVIRRLVLVVLFGFLEGCMLSPRVWSIGANSIEGSKSIDPETELAVVELSDAELMARFDSGILMLGYPYQDLHQIYSASHREIAILNVDDIKWRDDFNGSVSILIGGESKEFSVWHKGNHQLKLSHYYRDWYGYPAQTMLLVTYPLDFLQFIAGGTLFVLASPFMYVGAK